MFDLFQVLFAKDNVEPYGTSEKRVAVFGSVFFAFVSLLLTILNIVKHYWFMTGATSLLIVGFVAAAIVAKKGHKVVSRVMVALLCGLIFSVFAITGENDGFAILWILLVPLLGSLLVGLRVSFVLNLYFQLFLIALFYTPLHNSLPNPGVYTDTFMMRFPLLYFATFGAVTVMMCHRQKLLNEVDRQAHYDALTGLYNRYHYDLTLDALEDAAAYPHLTIFSFDLNELKRNNDALGHEAGDEMIRGAARVISQAFPGDTCFRTGGDEFVAISTSAGSQEKIQALRKATAAWQGELVKTINISVGAASREENPGLSVNELCKLADKAMYADKAEYYRVNRIDRRSR